MLQDSDLQTYTRYFEDIASSHKEIDQFLCGDKKMAEKQMIISSKGKILWLAPLEPISFSSDNKEESSINDYHCSVYICQDKRENSTPEQVIKKVGQCEKIVKQVRAKLLKDYNEGTINTNFWKFKYKTINELALNGQTMCGIKLEFNFKTPTFIKYDPDNEKL